MRRSIWARSARNPRPAHAGTLSPADVRRSATALLRQIPADRFSLSSVAQGAGMDLAQVRTCVPDTATLVAALHQHWYQRLAVRLDPILENRFPGRKRLEAIVNTWLDLALDTPGWPRLLERFSSFPPVREQIQHEWERLTDIAALDLTVNGGGAGKELAARLVSALPALALQEADAGRRLPDLRSQVIESAATATISANA